MQSGARPTDVTCEKRKVDQAAHIAHAVDVLCDAHSPERDRCPGLAVDARRLANERGGYAAEFLDRFGRPRLDASPERLVARNTRLDELFVAQTFSDQHMRHRIEERDVGPRLVGNNDVGVLREFARTGIDDDELHAALPGGTLEDRSGDREAAARVDADHEGDIRILDLGIGGRGNARAELVEERHDGAGVAEPRAMVDGIGAEAGANELLEEITFLVRAFGCPKPAERAGLHSVP